MQQRLDELAEELAAQAGAGTAAVAASCVTILWSISDFYDDEIFAGIVKVMLRNALPSSPGGVTKPNTVGC